jgi:hypothetical protein
MSVMRRTGVDLHAPDGRCSVVSGHGNFEIGGLEPANRGQPSIPDYRFSADGLGDN